MSAKQHKKGVVLFSCNSPMCLHSLQSLGQALGRASTLLKCKKREQLPTTKEKREILGIVGLCKKKSCSPSKFAKEWRTIPLY